MNITEQDKQILDSKTDLELAKLHTSFNCWECTNDFEHYNEEFKRLASLPLSKYEQNNIISQLKCYIESKITYKYLLRVNNDDMSDEEFADFYNGNFEKDIEAKHRYEIRSMQKIAKKYGMYEKFDWDKSFEEVYKQFSELEV